MFLNPKTNELNATIVYYGPELSGQTTSYQYMQDRFGGKGRVVFMQPMYPGWIDSFDFLPPGLEKSIGRKCRIVLCAVRVQDVEANTRLLMLNRADGLIFVADSQSQRAEANLESLEELERHLASQLGDNSTEIARAYSYNKRDLPDALPVAELEKRLNPQRKYPSFETIAPQGVGLVDSLKAVIKTILLHPRDGLILPNPPRKPPPVKPKARADVPVRVQSTNKPTRSDAIDAMRLDDTTPLQALLAATPASGLTAHADALLPHALRLRQVDAVSLLLDAGANPNVRDRDQCTPLMSVVRTMGRDQLRSVRLEIASKRLEITRLLLRAGASANPERVPFPVTRGAVWMFRPPLTLAAELGDVEIMRELLAQGAALEGRDYYDSTALIAATNRGELDAITVLLAAGADPNGVDYSGQTPLLRAVQWDPLFDLRQLMEIGAWRRPSELFQEIARRLLEHGAELERADNNGTTPLFAAIRRSLEFVDLLLRAGANVHHRDAAGEPALPYLVLRTPHPNESDMIPIAERLLAAGADPIARSASGHTAQELAHLRGHPLLAALLARQTI